ncbi:hypothetical protein R83H12_00674 [Fibrobacteria bacterium R8-3-H12]
MMTITPEKIQQQCTNWWKDVLVAYIKFDDFFPKEINRIGKITTKDLREKLPEILRSLEILQNNSKSNKKFGYSLIKTELSYKGKKHLIPKKVVIETLEDYLKIIEKEKEYQIFTNNYELLINELPILKEWVISHPKKMIDYNIWTDIIKVCKYFIKTPKPNLYIRELPIDVHTKFIEENEGILKELLDIVIKDYIQPDETDFEKRFNLKKDLSVRYIVLDPNISDTSGMGDLSIPINKFEQLELPLKNVLIVENKTNLFTIPELEKTMVIFGSGRGVGVLKNVKWFEQVRLFYWGDIDTDGFEILSQFRDYFPKTQSILMDKNIFDRYEKYRVKSPPSKISTPLNLTKDEQELYNLLKENNWRLEQEKIPIEEFNELIANGCFI